MKQEKNYEERPFSGLYIQSKPKSKEDLVPGMPYPEDFGTTVEQVRIFIDEYLKIIDEKPFLGLLICSIVLGAINLGLIFYFFYEDTIITIMFGCLGGGIGYMLYMHFYRLKKKATLSERQIYTSEGVYLAALGLWQNKCRMTTTR